LSLFPENTDATSPVIGAILTIAITIILALLVLLFFHMPSPAWQDTDVPAIFKIIKIKHEPNFDSYMTVINSGETDYKTQNLYAKTYRNGILLESVIGTMNGHDFISSHHFGVQYIVGMSGQTWNSNRKIGIDYKDKTFHPGDIVTFEVYDATTDQIISRHTYTA
jgi:hypothetical protein